ncbi:kinase-like protein [Jackrogersella minutella]|nr:kinase-like protein [Jackrogersella minutella]
MPARFPDRTRVTQPEVTQPQPNATPSGQLPINESDGGEGWSLGSEYALVSRRDFFDSAIDVRNTDSATEMVSGPALGLFKSWGEGDQFLMVPKPVKVESLEQALPNLTQEDIARIGQQLGKYLLKRKTAISQQMEMLDGGPNLDRRLFKPLPPDTPWEYAVCKSNAGVVANLMLAITDYVDRPTLISFMAKMPSAEPFVFSHSDVHEGTVMVKDGNFARLVGWELAGFYPSWWEFVNCCELLSDHLPKSLQNQEALEWFRVYHAIRELPTGEATPMLTAYLSK